MTAGTMKWLITAFRSSSPSASKSTTNGQSSSETEFEKYRIVQDRLFMSDYDRCLLELEEQIKKEKDDR